MSHETQELLAATTFLVLAASMMYGVWWCSPIPEAGIYTWYIPGIGEV
jgi:hypothetical protein